MNPRRILTGCTLAALVAATASCGHGGQGSENYGRAEMIAFFGHGQLFDREMNEIQPDLTLLSRIQLDILSRIEDEEFSRKKRAASPAVMEANVLLQKRELTREEELVVRARVIGEYLRDAPSEVRSRYGWRNHGIVSAFLNQSRYQISTDLRDLLAQLRDPNLGTDTGYMEYCRANQVPIPPDWAETGTAWAFQGTLTQNMLNPGEYAAVWTYTDPAQRGACIALPRGDGAPGSLAGIICQSATTGAACFWDNTSNEPEATEMALGWRGVRLVISQLMDGSTLGSPCPQCHIGTNVFLIAPDDTTWARVLRRDMAGVQHGTFTTNVESSTDMSRGYPRYVPLSRMPAESEWRNRYTGTCGGCHEMPEISNIPMMPPACATSRDGCYRP